MIPIRSSGRTFSVRQAAAYLELRVDHVYKLLKEGKLKGHRMGGVGFGQPSAEWVIPEASVMEYKKRRKATNG